MISANSAVREGGVLMTAFAEMSNTNANIHPIFIILWLEKEDVLQF